MTRILYSAVFAGILISSAMPAFAKCRTTHPGSCACTAGSFGGMGDLTGASGTTSADGNVCSAAQFAHGGGASAVRATSVAITAATSTNEPP